ncbi:hypothetical protein QQZ08_000590 [Neonectria magnoliae]|uniref:RRM domain-containing protein n=1 Tax=Neonectria magnoliae TaxID=2732573 RepID=A0ABR1IHR9_9HYPO
MPVQATTQADVGAGNRTGVYYIPICNLPFGTSWKELKDWIRSACAVEHIEVFQNSTSGWVRVNGRENFERAWGLLNGGVFKGRSIIASDKNRTEPIKIKEPVESSQADYTQTPRCQATPPAEYGSPASADWSPQYSAASGGQYSLGGYPQEDAWGSAGQPVAVHSYGHQIQTQTQTQTYAVADPGEYYEYSYGDLTAGPALTNPSAGGYPRHHQSEEAQFALPYRHRPEASSYYEGYGASPLTQPEYVVTEYRKLHVSPFPQQAGLGEVTSWLRRKVGSCDIATLDIPQNKDSRYLRGHALIVFESAVGAIRAKDLLNKARFQGRRVTPRLTVEGVSAQEPRVHGSSSSPEPTVPDSMLPAGPSRSRTELGDSGEEICRSKHGDSKGRTPVDSNKRLSLSHRKSSSSSKKSSHSEKKPPTPNKRSSLEKKTKEDPGPIVVDGTSRKHSKR